MIQFPNNTYYVKGTPEQIRAISRAIGNTEKRENGVWAQISNPYGGIMLVDFYPGLGFTFCVSYLIKVSKACGVSIPNVGQRKILTKQNEQR